MHRAPVWTAELSGTGSRRSITAMERAILIACVRARLGGTGRVPGITDASRRIDWSHLIEVACQHGVMPLVYEGLQAAPAPALPAAMMARLRHAFHANAGRNLARARALVDVIAALDRGGIPALTFKGPVLAASAYGSLSRRQFTDVDVLVTEADASRAVHALQSSGYVTAQSSASAVTLVLPTVSPRVCVDLQWGFADRARRFPLSVRDVWDRSEWYCLLDRRVRRLGLVDELLLLTAHPAKHCWSRLGWTADVAALIGSQASRLDWELAFERARKQGGVRQLCVGLHLAATIAGARLPDRVRAIVRADPRARLLAAELRRRLFSCSGARLPLNGGYGLVESALLELRTRERWLDRVPLAVDRARQAMQLVSFVPTDEDRRVVALTPAMRALYVAVRPVRLSLKYGPMVPRWLWRGAGAVAGR